MPEEICTSYSNCKLVNSNSLVLSSQERQCYIDAYCHAGEKAWQSCKRYVCREVLHFCPDFVLPDTELSMDEIVDKFDNQNQ